jgi:SPP1 family predicted phage head-tail adaptor
MYSAGTLIYRMSFYSLTQTLSDSGDPVPSWSLVATRRAGIKTVSSKEQEQADGTEGQKTHTITARYLAGLDHATKIVWGEREFQVLSVVNVDEANDWLVFTTNEAE